MLRDRIVDILKEYLQSGISCKECDGVVDDIVIESITDSIMDEFYKLYL